MAYRKAKTVSTPFFTGVTPISVPSEWTAAYPSSPGVSHSGPPVPNEYHAACYRLADWANSTWPQKSWASGRAANYFILRDRMIATSEGWRHYDWLRDEARIKELDDLRKCSANLLGSLKRSLHTPVASSLSSGLERANAQWSRAYVFGPIYYAVAPLRRCTRDVAIGLALADVVTQYMPGGKPNQSNRYMPNLVGALPWPAIWEFAKVSSGQPALEPNGFQARVTNLSRRDVRLRGWWNDNL